MASNTYVNKVVYGNTTLIDLSGDTVTTSGLQRGLAAHNAAGMPIIGTADFGRAIIVTAPSGSTVTGTKDGNTYTADESTVTPGTWEIIVPECGTYTIKAVYEGATKEKNVTVTDARASFNFVLPDGYTQLEYLESTGTQYIDLNINAQSYSFPFEASIVYQYSSILNDQISTMGASDKSGGNTTNLFLSNQTYHSYVQTKTGYAFVQSGRDLEKHTVTSIIASNSIAIDVDGISASNTQNNQSAISGKNLYLFAININGVANALMQGKIFLCSIKANQNAISELIPAKRDSDGAVGLYDTVRKNFYTNAGTGAFVAGPEV